MLGYLDFLHNVYNKVMIKTTSPYCRFVHIKVSCRRNQIPPRISVLSSNWMYEISNIQKLVTAAIKLKVIKSCFKMQPTTANSQTSE